MSNPKILIPRALAQIHPQLETAFKSVDVAVRAVQGQVEQLGRGGTAGAIGGGGGNAALASDVAQLKLGVAELAAALGSMPRGRGFAFFCG